jgi:hypothetical protein
MQGGISLGLRETPTCPEDGVFPGPTYCDRIIR